MKEFKASFSEVDTSVEGNMGEGATAQRGGRLQAGHSLEGQIQLCLPVLAQKLLSKQ